MPDTPTAAPTTADATAPSTTASTTDAPAKRRPMPATAFVRVWEQSRTLEEFCERTGYAPETASQRAWNMRRRGVKLRKMPQARRKLDVAELQAVAEQAAAEAAEAAPLGGTTRRHH